MGILHDLTQENSKEILRLNKEIYLKQKLVSELEYKENIGTLTGTDKVDLTNLKEEIVRLRKELNSLESASES